MREDQCLMSSYVHLSVKDLGGVKIQKPLTWNCWHYAVCIGAISNQTDPKVSSVATPFKIALIVCMAAMASFLSKSLVSSVSNN